MPQIKKTNFYLNNAVERSFYTADGLADLFFIKKNTLYNKVCREKFQVPTYKIGKNLVADKQVVDAYFDSRRLEGLLKLTTKKCAANS
jgi:hypothetical protein